MRRIDKGHACFQHQAPNCAAAQKVFELGQIRARIDAGDFAGVVVLVQSNLFLSVSQDSRHIGEVIFALAVAGLHPLERLEQLRTLETVNARVDFSNLPLFIRRIFLFDDLHKASGFSAHHATVASGIFHADSENRAGCIVLAMLLNQLLQSLGPHQRHIAREDQHA